MKSKYKVEHFFGSYIIWKGGKSVCECRTKHMAYKIKSALEMSELKWRFDSCDDCINDDTDYRKEPCTSCKITHTKIKSHFKPKEKK